MATVTATIERTDQAGDSQRPASGRERIRLLFVLPSPVLGGAEGVVLELLKRLEPENFQLGLACPGPLLEQLGPELEGLPIVSRAIAANSWLQIGEVRKLSRFLKEFRPHIVNSHIFRATLVAAPLAKAMGVPRVIETYHGREAWRRGVLKGSFFWDRQIGRCVDRVIAVSSSAQDFLVTRKKLPAEKIRVIPNGRELTRFVLGGNDDATRTELGIPLEAPLLGVIARLEPQKGHRYLLRAMPAILAAEPEARLLLVGSGYLRDELARQARELGISERVIFAGFREDVPRFFAVCDLVVLPSLYEGMPLAAIEAGASAQAIVATDVDGTAEVVVDGSTGLLVPAADSDALAEAIGLLLGDRPRRREMGRRAREHVLSRFDVRTQVATTARLYIDEISSHDGFRGEGTPVVRT